VRGLVSSGVVGGDTFEVFFSLENPDVSGDLEVWGVEKRNVESEPLYMRSSLGLRGGRTSLTGPAENRAVTVHFW